MVEYGAFWFQVRYGGVIILVVWRFGTIVKISIVLKKCCEVGYLLPDALVSDQHPCLARGPLIPAPAGLSSGGGNLRIAI